MFLYNIRIALKSLRRNPLLTTLLVAAIAVGICISTTFTSLRHIMTREPLPGKTQDLFYVRLDNWDPGRAYLADDPHSLPTQVSYRDMRALMESKIPTHQTAAFTARFFVFPGPRMGSPYPETIRLTFSDFFTMFEVPFRYGGPWTKAAEQRPEPVVVISDATNQKLFRGENSVGRTVRLGERDFKVVGVLAAWRPAVKFYDPTMRAIDAPEAIYMPLNFTESMKIRTAGNSDGWKALPANTFEGFLQSETVWLNYWVELRSAEQQRAYRQYVSQYITSQKKLGRFGRPLHFEVTPMMPLLREMNAVPPQVNAMSAVSLLFLIVCSVNLIGILLGKFLARAPEVSVRRALGASRREIFLLHVIECELVGLAGGIIGIVLSGGILTLMSKVLPGNIPLHLDAEMIATAAFLSLAAGLLAGLYPAWRVCRVAPAMQLKLQ